MSFQDILKSTFLENFTNTVNIMDIIYAILFSTIASIFIIFIYRNTTKNVTFSKSFEITLIMMAVISTLIVTTITSNVVLSLGMVGALSIVRFRTAVKDPIDTAFMFWAVAAGITSGSGQVMLTVIGSLLISIVVFIASKVIHNTAASYLLIVKAGTETAANYIERALSETGIRSRLSSYNNNARGVEVIYEIAISSNHTKLITAIKKIPDINDVILVDCKNTPN